MTDTPNPLTHLTDGRNVPTACVDALTALDTRWPGATFHGARPAIAAAVLEAAQVPLPKTPRRRATPLPVYAVSTITCRTCGRVLAQSIPRVAEDDEIENSSPVSPAFAQVPGGCPDHPAGPPDDGLRYTPAACPVLWTIRLIRPLESHP